MEKQALGRGYGIALTHYKTQKQNFLNLLKSQISEEETKAIEDLGEILVNPGDNYKEEGIKNIIGIMQEAIDNSGDIKAIADQATWAYKDLGITKQDLNNKLKEVMSTESVKNWFSKELMQNLNDKGYLGSKGMEDNALIGRIRMIFRMGMRHGGVLKPGDFTVSQLSGVLYEHALADACKNYFQSLGGNLADIVEVNPVGAKGGRADISFIFHPEKFNGRAIGTSEVKTFNMSVKNIDFDAMLTAQDHSKNLRVGGGAKIFGEELKKIKTVKDSMYFLSRGRRVIEALGEDTSFHGFTNGKIKFTYDLIKTMHYQNYYLLGTPNPSKTYIEWMYDKYNLINRK